MLAVVEDEGAVDGAHRRVHRAQRRRALDVHVDVARDHRLDPVGVGAELAGRRRSRWSADVGRLDLVADDVGAAVDLRLAFLVAVGQAELDLRGGSEGADDSLAGSGSLAAGSLAGRSVSAAACGENEEQRQREEEGSGFACSWSLPSLLSTDEYGPGGPPGQPCPPAVCRPACGADSVPHSWTQAYDTGQRAGAVKISALSRDPDPRLSRCRRRSDRTRLRVGERVLVADDPAGRDAPLRTMRMAASKSAGWSYVKRAAHDELASDERLGRDARAGGCRGRGGAAFRRPRGWPSATSTDRRRADGVDHEVECARPAGSAADGAPSCSAKCDALRVHVMNVDRRRHDRGGQATSAGPGTDSDHQDRRQAAACRDGAARPRRPSSARRRRGRSAQRHGSATRSAPGTTSRSASAPGRFMPTDCRATHADVKPRRHWAQVRQAMFGSTTTVWPMRSGRHPGRRRPRSCRTPRGP